MVSRPRSAQTELGGGPAIAEAAGRAHGAGVEFDGEDVGGVRDGAVAVGEEAQLVALAVFVEDFEGALPGVELGGVEFAEVEDLALDDAGGADANGFADGVVGVGLAVFGAGAGLEIHAGEITTEREGSGKGVGRPTRGGGQGKLRKIRGFRRARARKKSKTSEACESRASVSAVQNTFRLARAATGLPAEATVHTLRHCYATQMLEEGVSLRLISQYLGHASLETTVIYTHLTPLNEARTRAALSTLHRAVA